VTTRRDVASSLDVAAAHSLNAHRALGRMSACTSVADFSEAAIELMAAARGISQTLTLLARLTAIDSSERRRAFTGWFAAQALSVLQHPMHAEVHGSSLEPPAVYLSRIARGSDHPPIREATMLARMAAMKPRPEDFYFEGVDKRPAIEMCSEYLERVTSLLDQSRQAMKRFGLE
jgi:hypothetical protein